MSNPIPEADLHQLRDLIARLYGEDIAQDSMVRILSREYRENWFRKELRWARKQWKLEEMQARGLVSFDEEAFPKPDDTDRILSWIELREKSQTNLAFRRLMLIELGVNPMPYNVTISRLRERSGK